MYLQLVLVGFVCLTVSCGVGYIVSSSYYQLELLALREPVDEVRLRGTLTRKQLGALRTIEDARYYATSLGFEVSGIYTSVALEWKREMWNVSACESLNFEPRTWWFPIVGRVPYLGFFSEEKASEFYEELSEEPGWDLQKRRVGAYSTLGYFDDPILPSMLEWNTVSLLNLVFHELVHATVWLPSSVVFNESFANFVGEKATLRYLEHRYGANSPKLVEAQGRFEDGRRFRALLWGLYHDLDKLYRRADLKDLAKHQLKQKLYGSLEARVEKEAFWDQDWARKRIRYGVWNNARLMQFRRYNSDHAYFELLFQRFSGDFRAFFGYIERLIDSRENPSEVLKRAALAATQ